MQYHNYPKEGGGGFLKVKKPKAVVVFGYTNWGYWVRGGGGGGLGYSSFRLDCLGSG